jgi:hypothetical protein
MPSVGENHVILLLQILSEQSIDLIRILCTLLQAGLFDAVKIRT